MKYSGSESHDMEGSKVPDQVEGSALKTNIEDEIKEAIRTIFISIPADL